MTQKQYAVRNAMQLDKAGGYYARNVQAMTAEGLHSKGDIAAELGYRDMQIAALQQQVNALAAENTELMKFCKNASFDADYEAELSMERGGFSNALNDVKTLDTDAYLNSVRAEGVEMFGKYIALYHSDSKLHAVEFAAKLRAGEQGGDHA